MLKENGQRKIYIVKTSKERRSSYSNIRADFRARKVIRDKESYYAMIKTSHQRKYAGGK